MQHLHDEGHDVPALARATVTEDPLGRQPAQDLRYRLVVISPPPQKQVSRHSGIVGTTTEKTRPERREAARRDRSPRAPGR
ncbi:hypothetical protein BCF74_1535 [Knoellia remsis]|uniref:Uncharacterized protein n=1 Tax=Knoellia remsis TaxID=407159 RepID=A0A2T0TQV2_9MICO|nr:hypothetical protein [Knoellia remsis]PRY48060.1 hypothetical protein BCF74_1535 [Knoellia remsis]